jgi:hypothetical protein
MMTRFTAPFAFGVAVSLAALLAAAPPARGDEVGTVAAVEGSAEIGRNGTWGAAAAGTAVAVGDQLRTGQPGRMRVVFRDDSVLVLSDSTTLTVDAQVFDPNGSESVFNLLEGKLKSIVSHYYGAAGSSYEVRTSTAVAGVRGTEFVMTYDSATGATEVVGIRGVVTVHSAVDPAGPGMLVTANEATAVAAGALPGPKQRVDPEFMRQLLDDMEFFGSNQGTSLTDSSALIAGATVARPGRAPTGPAALGAAALVLAPEGVATGTDASSALGNSPAAVISGGHGSISVNPGRH